MTRLLAALLLACSLAAAGCTTTQTTSTGWGQIAAGVGTVIGPTKADAKVAKASAELQKYCGALQAVAFGATIFAPQKQQNIAAMASAAVNAVCAKPTNDVAGALTTAVEAYEAVQAARANP